MKAGSSISRVLVIWNTGIRLPVPNPEHHSRVGIRNDRSVAMPFVDRKRVHDQLAQPEQRNQKDIRQASWIYWIFQVW